MISTGDIRKGTIIELEGQLLKVVDFQHVKLGRGSAFMRMTLKNIRTGASTTRTFQAGEKFEQVRLERRTVQYLYKEDGNYHFMDTETYEQPVLTGEVLGETVNYIKEGDTIDLLVHGGEPIDIELPTAVVLCVETTEPGFKGDTATGGNKPAIMETGMTVNVPLFINEGDLVKVDTRTGEYLERVTS
ncbi:MAG: elongation factor P [Chloroflexi bacterium]|nr:elongation factor P [Chloroflexota bacterium]